MIFPMLARWRALNLPPVNILWIAPPAYACFCKTLRATKSRKLNDLRIQTSCLGEFHRDGWGEQGF